MMDAGSAEASGMAKETRKTWMCMGAAFITALILALAVLAISGINIDGIELALRVTARLSFLLFLLAYAGGSLAALFGARFRALARQGRNFGLSFVAAHSVHVLLVIWLYRLSPELPISTRDAVFFSIGLLWMYMLAVLSIQHLARLLGTHWRTVRLVAMEYIMLLFQHDFLHASLMGHDANHLLGYLPFAILGVAGWGLHIAGWIQKMHDLPYRIFLLGRLRH
jgi:hypothetical protein